MSPFFVFLYKNKSFIPRWILWVCYLPLFTVTSFLLLQKLAKWVWVCSLPSCIPIPFCQKLKNRFSMHLSHVGICLTTFLSSTDASVLVRKPPGASKHIADSILWARRGGIHHRAAVLVSNAQPDFNLGSLTSTHDSTWPELIQPKEEVTRHVCVALEHRCHKHPLRSVSARMTNPAFPCYAGVLSSVKSIMQVLLLPQVCKDRGYAQSWHAQVWPRRKMRKTKQIWGNSPKGTALFSGQPLAGIRMSLVPRVSPDAAGATGARCRKGLGGEVRLFPWRMRTVVLSRVQLHVFAQEKLLWVSVLHFHGACALCKQRGRETQEELREYWPNKQ